MSFIPKLQTVLGVVLILTAGAIIITAQTPAVADTPSKPIADIVLPYQRSEDVRNGESKKTATAPTEDSSPEKTSEPDQEVAIVNTIEATFATAARKPSTSSKSALPQGPQAVDEGWHFQVTPYFWLMSLHGNAGVGNRTVGVDMSFGDVFGTLNFFAMGTFEARNGRFFSLTDVEYASISDENATPGPLFSSVDAGFKMFIFDQEVGYRLYENSDGASVDVLGGVRVWHLSTDFEFGAGILPANRVDGSRTWVDGVGGLRGKAPVTDKIFVTGKFDLGGGGSDFTWQVFGGAGYNINPNFALIGGYRVLDVNYNKNNFLYDINHRGPIFGLGFKF